MNNLSLSSITLPSLCLIPFSLSSLPLSLSSLPPSPSPSLTKLMKTDAYTRMMLTAVMTRLVMMILTILSVMRQR